jgi:aminoglycoside phosphotransferase (APT) family kinase protein
VPAVYAFTDDAMVSDVPLLLTAFVDGPLAGDLDDQACAEVGPAMVRALARVHEVDLAATGLDDLASHAPYAERQLRRWRRQWEMSKTREMPALTRLSERLDAAVPRQHELTLVHGDFHPQNVIFTPGGDGVRAILDWELCTLGDPIADLGALLAYWPDPAGVEPLAEAYARETGRDLAALPFWHALALWKVAIICEGVRRRALDHDANAPSSGIPHAGVVDVLVARAARVAEEAGL